MCHSCWSNWKTHLASLVQHTRKSSCSGAQAGTQERERHLFSIACFCPGVCINTSSPLFCSRSLHVRVMLLLYLILSVKPFAPQELTVSSPDHLQLFRPLYQSNVLTINIGQQQEMEGKKAGKQETCYGQTELNRWGWNLVFFADQ